MMRRDLAHFTVLSYAADKAYAFVVTALVLAFAAVMLALMAVPSGGIFMICLTIFLGFTLCLCIDYLRKRFYYRKLSRVTEDLQHVRHLSAFLDDPSFLEGRLSWDAAEALADISGRETMVLVEDGEAYHRFIETWVHEMKTPIAASKLVLARMRGADATALRQELERIESYVEQVLFYARSEDLFTDYSIREVLLEDVAKEACKRNQNLLITSGVTPAFCFESHQTVFADASWLTFVLGQLVANSAKYGAKTVRFMGKTIGEGTSARVVLEIADDGAGIPAEDMPRIFERGFVGVNGRSQGSATGMGLYLCARLCAAMGLSIEAASEEGAGTRLLISFPVNRDLFR